MSTFKPQQGKILPYYWADGKLESSLEVGVPVVPTLSQAMDYSVLIFEGIRVNVNSEGRAFGFRLKDHIKRLFSGWKKLGFSSPWNSSQVLRGMISCIEKNLRSMHETGDVQSIYVRPKIFHADPTIKPMSGAATRITIECFPLGNYMAAAGVTATLVNHVRTYRYSGYETKGAGKYVEYGMLRDSSSGTYDDVLQLGLGKGGKLIFTEGTHSNVFFVVKNELYTSGLDDFILHGITRDSVIKMAHYLGIKVHEGEVPLSLILEAEEIFFTGTASFITPVKRLGRYTLENAPVTRKLSEFFARVRTGKIKAFRHWLTPFAV